MPKYILLCSMVLPHRKHEHRFPPMYQGVITKYTLLPDALPIALNGIVNPLLEASHVFYRSSIPSNQ